MARCGVALDWPALQTKGKSVKHTQKTVVTEWNPHQALMQRQARWLRRWQWVVGLAVAGIVALGLLTPRLARSEPPAARGSSYPFPANIQNTNYHVNPAWWRRTNRFFIRTPGGSTGPRV